MYLQEVEVTLLFDELMTPKWIESNAEITGDHKVTEGYFEILPTTGPLYVRALRVPLVPPNVLNSNDSTTIVIIASMDTVMPQTTDYDPNIGISDGKSYIGFEAPDIRNYHNYPPCFSVNADVGETGLQNVEIERNAPFTSSTHYPSVVRMQFKPAEKWGSCETPQGDGGYSNLGFYQSALDPKNGLYFEFYHHHANEEYHIKYIHVHVQWE